jgi:hypothetical protein
MSHMTVETREGRTAFEPGGTVEGTAAWSLDAPPDKVSLTLCWYTAGKGTQDVRVVETLHLEAPGREDRRDFRFALPSTPWSFSGTLVSVCWAVELVVEPGAVSTRREITVAPGGKEIVLPADVPQKEEDPGARGKGGFLRSFFGSPVRRQGER